MNLTIDKRHELKSLLKQCPYPITHVEHQAFIDFVSLVKQSAISNENKFEVISNVFLTFVETQCGEGLHVH